MAEKSFKCLRILVVSILMSAFALTGADHSRWLLLSKGIPVARRNHVMVYDAKNSRTLLFGGSAWLEGDTWESLGAAWELTGAGWQEISGYSPNEDYNAMIYDESRNAIYAFASRAGALSMYNSPNEGFKRGTYILEKERWRPAAVDNPPARTAFSLSYDARRTKLVLFGGRVFQNNKWIYLNDTWEYDGKVWNPAAKGGPPARANHGAAYDEVTGCVLLFGGEDGKNQLGDTWKWDGRAWQQVVTNGPTSRSSTSMVYDKARKRVVLFGGLSSSNFSLGDTWDWNGTEWHPVAGKGPPPRIGHAMVYNNSIKKTQLFGGSVSMRAGTYGDLWEFDGEKWTQRLEPPAPSEIAVNRLVPFPPMGGLLLLSGLKAGYPAPEMWFWQKDHWSLLPGKGPVSTNQGFAMSYDSRRKRVVLVGGTQSAKTWEWDGTTWHVAATEGPGARYEPSMAYDSVHDRTILFGGVITDSSKPVIPNDTWQWDGKTWSRLDTDVTPRSSGGMAFDAKRKKIVLFSGDQETWEWDGNRWHRVASIGPTSRLGYAMAYSPEHEAVILYGGFRGNESPLNDTWQWNGTNWEKMIIPGPSRRMSSDHPCLAYDEISKMIILFNQSHRNETWGLR
jgi:hypothetical protein